MLACGFAPYHVVLAFKTLPAPGAFRPRVAWQASLERSTFDVSLWMAGNPLASIIQKEFLMEPIHSSIIIATQIGDDQRLEFLPRHFERYMLILEQAVYSYLRLLCAGYQGGYWDYFDLSNGGCYLAPSASKGYRIEVQGNGFAGCLDAQCAGIVATLFALSHCSMRYPTVERFSERFYQLREFACEHPDGNLILAAID